MKKKELLKVCEMLLGEILLKRRASKMGTARRRAAKRKADGAAVQSARTPPVYVPNGDFRK